MLNRRLFIAGLVGFAVQAQAEMFFVKSGLAIRGYDPVAYFTMQKAVKGSADFQMEWGGVLWQFSSQAHKDAFAAEPERYAPQFGGYCAQAVASGYTASTDPEAWTVHNGKLYLNYSKSVRQSWLKDMANNIEKGEANWPKLKAKL